MTFPLAAGSPPLPSAHDGEEALSRDVPSSSTSPDWPQKLRATVGRYNEPLVRLVARKLLKPRSAYTVDDLRERMVEAATNAVLIDRRLKELSEPARSVLALIGMSQQPIWRLGGVLELLGFVQAGNGLDAVFELFHAGFLYPDRAADAPMLESVEQWLGSSRETHYQVWVPPAISARAWASGPPTLEKLTDVVTLPSPRNHETDGWELLLRLAFLWQQVRGTALRLTAQGEFYKRDQERLQEAALTAPLGEAEPLPDGGHALIAYGLGLGLLRRQEGEIVANDWPTAWRSATLPQILAEFWSVQPHLTAWTPADGWRGLATGPTPFASASVLALAALRQLGEKEWVPPAAVGEWVAVHHPYWQAFEHPPDLTAWAEHFLLGLASALKLVQTAVEEGRKLVRLSTLGARLLGQEPEPTEAAFPRTLLVQPNLEILAYRQGLTPGLLVELSYLARWKALGAACTLQLEPETVYRGLQAGLSFEQTVQLLQRHSVRDLPPNVLQALKTWSDKRERITVYTSANLLEFKTPEEAEDALHRGLPAVRLSETCLLVSREEDMDFRLFKLSGTRDYSQPPGVCVETSEDGVTLTIDEGRADLLLMSELDHYAERQSDVPATGQRRYRLTPARLQALRAAPSSVRQLEEWFQQRTGQPLTPAARLLLNGPESPSLALRRLVVLEVASPAVADGLEQWPETRAFLQSRLGPQAVAVAEEHLDALRAKLAEIKFSVQEQV